MTISAAPLQYEDFPTPLEFFRLTDLAFLSGGFGSQLRLRGAPSEGPDGRHAIASLDASGLVTEVHSAYAHAGATILTVDTFDLSPWRQKKLDREFGHTWASNGITAAYDAARETQNRYPDRPLYLAGSLTSLEDCYDPSATPADDILLREHFHHVALHAKAGADLLCLETLPTVREAAAMVKAAEAHDLPFIVSFTVGRGGNPLDGNSIEAAEVATRSPLRIGIGSNCCEIEDAISATRKLHRQFQRNAQHAARIVAYPNGYAHTRAQHASCTGAGTDAWHDTDCESKKTVLPAQEFAQTLLNLRRHGASIVGGCCGTTPEHTDHYVRALGGRIAGPSKFVCTP